MHCLKHRWDSSHVRIDLRVCQELRGQVAVQPDLHLGGGVDPQAGVEQAVVEQLLEQQVAVVGGTGHQILGKFEESVEKIRGEMFSTWLGQQVGNYQESPTRYNLLLNTSWSLNKFTDELH